MQSQEEQIEIIGARVHNLKNISLNIPRNKLVVLTGLSGSGKSSLAFDTIYAEGQRRYIETFSSYARQFIGNMERPDVDKISGLSPVISIEQKTVNKNPRSTVGTITEIYDFLRLLFARAGDAYSHATGEKMVKYTNEQIVKLILEKYNYQKIILLAPIIKGRKGHYSELFESYLKKGYSKMRIDGEVKDLIKGMKLQRYQVHDIELVVDRLEISKGVEERLSKSLQVAMKEGEGTVMILLHESVPVTSNKKNKATISKTKSNHQAQVALFSKHLMCPTTGIAYIDPAPNLFSFNSPYGACPNCSGLGVVSEISIDKIVPNATLSIRKGAIAPIGIYKSNLIFKKIEALANEFKFTLDTPFEKIPKQAVNVLFNGSNESFNMQIGEYGFSTPTTFDGIVTYLTKQAEEDFSPSIQKWIEGFSNKINCKDCNGTRLKKEALYYKIDSKNIAQLSNMDIIQLAHWFEGIEKRLTKNQLLIATEIIKEIKTRIQFLLDVGLTYLTLNRTSKALSGGEAQRIRLATQIGTQLVGVLYILDEPSIGLHQRDNIRLINSLQKLRDIGNSVLVVEHDKDMIMASDYVIDIGPGAGIHGGTVVAADHPLKMIQSNTVTANYLNNITTITIPTSIRKGNNKSIKIIGATGNNLKNISVEFPLAKMICVTGVSGSGKSSLINETLYPILSKHFYKSEKNSLPYKKIEGLEHIDKVINIDQSPIGRTPRSNPATYTNVFTDIRNLFADITESKIRGYKSGRFSFNVKGGRCETCMGGGVRTIEMNFLPDVYVNCDACNGKRYNRETLEIRYKNKSISDILNMTISQACEFFEHLPRIYNQIKTIKEVGLGYVTLGQQATTLSGGEAQRIKLATELAKKGTGNTFYILDEPTTGLHFEDINVLLQVLNKLVNSGNTVLIIEHNMDMIRSADFIIDIGPEGGSGGGEVLFTGTLKELLKHKTSYTAHYLKKELE